MVNHLQSCNFVNHKIYGWFVTLLYQHYGYTILNLTNCWYSIITNQWCYFYLLVDDYYIILVSRDKTRSLKQINWWYPMIVIISICYDWLISHVWPLQLLNGPPVQSLVGAPAGTLRRMPPGPRDAQTQRVLAVLRRESTWEVPSGYLT